MKKLKQGQKQSDKNPNFNGIQQLLDSEESLVGYTTSIVEKFANHIETIQNLKKQKMNILEFGAGTAFLSEIFRKKFGINPDFVEIDPFLISVIKEKGFICYKNIDELQHKYDYIYTSNVLEHIENDFSILEELYQVTQVNGGIGIYIPAHQFLFSEMDNEIGHFRRYSKSEIIDKVSRAGFVIEKVLYDDFLGFFASLIVKLLGYKKRTGLGSIRSLKFYDKYAYPVSQKLDELGFKYILGKNILVLGRKLGGAPYSSD